MFERRKIRKLKNEVEIKRLEKTKLLIEELSDTVKDVDESEWSVLGQKDEKEYTPADLSTLRKNVRILVRTNGIAKGLLAIMVNYIIGKRLKIIPDDKNEEVIDYWKLFEKQNSFDLKIKEAIKRLIRDGEIFNRVFTPLIVENPLLIRFIDPEEIKDNLGTHTYGIETNPEDVEEVYAYWRGDERIPAMEIMHIKYGVDSNQKRGMSFFVGIISDITDYGKWLDGRKKLNRLRGLFALVGKPLASSAQTTKDLFEDKTLATSDYDSTSKKKVPPSGSVIFSKGVDWNFQRLNINASDTKEDGRSILLMIAAGTGGLPEYMVTADSSNSNYSSTLVSEAPGIKVFEAFQDIAEKIINEIFERVIIRGIETGVLPEKTDQDVSMPDGEIKNENLPTKTTCSIDFPLLIHRDRLEQVQALTLENDSGYTSRKTAASELGRDFEKEQIKIKREKEDESY